MKTTGFVNQKGGVGKSTCCDQTARAAHELGLRVLLVDLDPQGSLSTAHVATGQHEGEASTASQLFAQGGTIVPEVLQPGLSIIRADDVLRQLRADNREGLKRPAKHLKALAKDFDLCLIDTPGALGENVPTTTAALIAADYVVCPFAVGLFEAKPLNDLWMHLQQVIESGQNPNLRVAGLLPSKVNIKSGEEKGALDDLRQHPVVGKFILPVVLGERAAVKQAIFARKPVWRGVRGEGHKTAAAEWKAATKLVLQTVGVLK